MLADFPERRLDLEPAEVRVGDTSSGVAPPVSGIPVFTGGIRHWMAGRLNLIRSGFVNGHLPIAPSFSATPHRMTNFRLCRRSSRGSWVRPPADAGLRYYQELTRLHEQALRRIVRAAGRSL
jgi:hypothetical protein